MVVSFSVVASSQVFGSQYGRLEKPRVPRKKPGPHTHRTNIDGGPWARWWKWGSNGALKGLGVLNRG